MKNFLKRLSIEALKTGFRHYRDDTMGKIRKGLADRYESFADKAAVIIRSLWLAILISSFCSAGLVIIIIGLLLLCAPIIFEDGVIDRYNASIFGGFVVAAGLACMIVPLAVILKLTSRETIHEMLEVEDVRKKLTE